MAWEEESVMSAKFLRFQAGRKLLLGVKLNRR